MVSKKERVRDEKGGGNMNKDMSVQNFPTNVFQKRKQRKQASEQE